MQYDILNAILSMGIAKVFSTYICIYGSFHSDPIPLCPAWGVVQAGAENRTGLNRVELGRGADTNSEILTNTSEHSRFHKCVCVADKNSSEQVAAHSMRSSITCNKCEGGKKRAGAGSQSLSFFLYTSYYIRQANSIFQMDF